VAVILVPLSAISLMVLGWRVPWRRVYSLPIAGMAIIGAVAAALASGSGEALQISVRRAARAAGANARFQDHPEQGQTAQLFAILFAVTAVTLFVADRWGTRMRLPKWTPTAVYAVASLAGAVATIAMVVAGHSGATLVWKDVGTYAAAK